MRLHSCIRFSTEVTEARYEAGTQRWVVEVRRADGTTTTEHADALVSAVGQLNRPSLPAIAGRDTFGGRSFHSAEWDDSVSLVGRRVAVIGSGASAAQFVPAVADVAAHLDLYQRTPPWLMPTENSRDPFPPAYHSLLERVPTHGRWDRLWQFWLMHEGLLPAARVDPTWPDQRHSVSESNDFMRAMLTDLLRAQVPDEALFDKMVPRFPPFAKRALRDDGIWATTVQREHVDLITEPISEITTTGIRTTDGRERPADVVIYGTGFTASQFLTPMRLLGRGGVDLNEQWDGDARAYLGMTVPEFPPNFFMLYGPDTEPGHQRRLYRHGGVPGALHRRGPGSPPAHRPSRHELPVRRTRRLERRDRRRQQGDGVGGRRTCRAGTATAARPDRPEIGPLASSTTGNGLANRTWPITS